MLLRIVQEEQRGIVKDIEKSYETIWKGKKNETN